MSINAPSFSGGALCASAMDEVTENVSPAIQAMMLRE
jgi:hypothetical protein